MTRCVIPILLAVTSCAGAAPRLVELPGKSPLITIRIVFTTGAASDPADKPGLAHLTGDQDFQTRAARSLRAFAPKMKAQPTIAPLMLVALGRSLHEAEQVILRVKEIDAESEELERGYTQKFSPSAVVLSISDQCAAELHDVAPFLASLERRGRITIYECRNFTCQLPKVIE